MCIYIYIHTYKERRGYIGICEGMGYMGIDWIISGHMGKSLR